MPGPLDDAGLRPAALHERRDAVSEPAAERARAERDGHLPAGIHDPPRLALAPCRPPLRRRRGRALRARERRAGRDREGLAHAGGVRHQRPRPPRRPERARRRRRPLVGRELRRRPGPVVARWAAALHPSRLADGARRRGARRDRRAVHRDRRARRGTRPGRTRTRRSEGRTGERSVRRRGARAAIVVGGGAGALHARAQRRGRDRLDLVRLPARRDSRPSAARQRRARADRRRQPARSRRHPWPRRHPGADGAGRAVDEAVRHQRGAHVALPERSRTGSSSATDSGCTSSTRQMSSRTRTTTSFAATRATAANGSSASRTWSSATRTIRA